MNVTVLVWLPLTVGRCVVDGDNDNGDVGGHDSEFGYVCVDDVNGDFPSDNNGQSDDTGIYDSEIEIDGVDEVTNDSE